MAEQFTRDQLNEILIDRIGIPEEDVKSGSGDTTFDDLGLDSLAFIEIQLEMDQRYGIEVSEDDAQQIQTLDDAIEYVNARLAGTT